MRTSAARAALLLLVALPLPAGAEDARTALSRTLERALAVLADEELTSEQRVERVEAIVDERFDHTLIARLVLARSYRKLTPEQRVEFEQEFKRHLSLSYGRRVERYAGEQVEVGAARNESNGDVTVATRIVGGDQDGALVDYRLRRRDGTWYVIDVIIEGVSMLQNFRTQIQEIVSSKGTDHLIQTLREKNAVRDGAPRN